MNGQIVSVIMPRKTRRRNFGSQSSISKDEFIQILFEVRALTCFGSARCFLACSPSSWTSTNSLNGGKGGKKGDSGHFADFLRDFLRGRNVSGQGKGQGKTLQEGGRKGEGGEGRVLLFSLPLLVREYYIMRETHEGKRI